MNKKVTASEPKKRTVRRDAIAEKLTKLYAESKAIIKEELALLKRRGLLIDDEIKLYKEKKKNRDEAKKSS